MAEQQLTQDHRHIALATPLGKDVLLLRSFNYHEALGRPFVLTLELYGSGADVDFDRILGHNVTVRIAGLNDKPRYLNGYVSRFAQLPAADSPLPAYQATVVPWLWLLTRAADCRIFQQKSVRDILQQVFEDHGLRDFDMSGLTDTYRTWEYCVQYRETDFNFVSRLMEQEGIYYYFKHEDGKHTLMLADSPRAHSAFPEYEKIQFLREEGHAQEGILGLTVSQQVVSGAYAHTDFNFKNPRTDLSARKQQRANYGNSEFEIFDYPGEYDQASEGEAYAQRRLDDQQVEHETFEGSGTAAGVAAGSVFELTDHPDDAYNRKYLVTSASLSASTGTFASAGAGRSEQEAVHCEFSALRDTLQFRAGRTAPKPLIQGPQTAIVVGPGGEEIYTDDHGRVKVQFHWDRRSRADETSSCFIRVAQLWAGKQWGALFLPRIGQEVIVEFLEGDPDRPIITGRVYNGEEMPPYALPDNKTRSTIKSNSTIGGAGFNEIRFEDKKDQEQIFVHAQTNHDQRVGNDSKEWIGRDRHLIVKRDQLEQVEGDKHSTVGGNQNTNIDGTVSLTVKQAIHQKTNSTLAVEAGQEIHLKAGMKAIIEAGTQLTIKVGGNFVDIGPAGVTIVGTQVKINSGGAAGSGSGASPENAKLPEQADHDDPGRIDEPPPAGRPGAQAQALIEASKTGAPFCEECERARREQAAQEEQDRQGEEEEEETDEDEAAAQSAGPAATDHEAAAQADAQTDEPAAAQAQAAQGGHPHGGPPPQPAATQGGAPAPGPTGATQGPAGGPAATQGGAPAPGPTGATQGPAGGPAATQGGGPLPGPTGPRPGRATKSYKMEYGA